MVLKISQTATPLVGVRKPLFVQTGLQKNSTCSFSYSSRFPFCSVMCHAETARLCSQRQVLAAWQRWHSASHEMHARVESCVLKRARCTVSKDPIKTCERAPDDSPACGGSASCGRPTCVHRKMRGSTATSGRRATKCRESCVGNDRAHEMRTNLVVEPRENYRMQCDCQK